MLSSPAAEEGLLETTNSLVVITIFYIYLVSTLPSNIIPFIFSTSRTMSSSFFPPLPLPFRHYHLYLSSSASVLYYFSFLAPSYFFFFRNLALVADVFVAFIYSSSSSSSSSSTSPPAIFFLYVYYLYLSSTLAGFQHHKLYTRHINQSRVLPSSVLPLSLPLSARDAVLVKTTNTLFSTL